MPWSAKTHHENKNTASWNSEEFRQSQCPIFLGDKEYFMAELAKTDHVAGPTADSDQFRPSPSRVKSTESRFSACRR